jgi:hypothetical protein
MRKIGAKRCMDKRGKKPLPLTLLNMNNVKDNSGTA